MEFNQSDLFINSDSPEEEYRRRNIEEKSAVAYGQRKLLLTLTQFLTYFLDLDKYKSPIVVYAGAAPGINIGIATTLFPEIEWHLYDPANFKIKENKDKKIHIYQECFTDKIAHYWSNKDIYFISDIRTADYIKSKNLDDNEKQIMKDMSMQMKWVNIINPIKSQLKFRLPYTGGNRPEKIEYLDGMVFKQIWAPQTSTETRLVPFDDLKTVIWNCKKYQSQLFYHNVVVREQNKYLNLFTRNESIDPPELLNDYDSRGEIQIWMDYLSFRNAEVNKSNVVALSRLATAKLNKGKKYSDTLEYLRAHPRAIKERNFNKTRDDRKIINRKYNLENIQKWSEWLNKILQN